MSGIRALGEGPEGTLCPSVCYIRYNKIAAVCNLQDSSHQKPTMLVPYLRLSASRAVRNELSSRQYFVPAVLR